MRSRNRQITHIPAGVGPHHRALFEAAIPWYCHSQFWSDGNNIHRYVIPEENSRQNCDIITPLPYSNMGRCCCTTWDTPRHIETCTKWWTFSGRYFKMQCLLLGTWLTRSQHWSSLWLGHCNRYYGYNDVPITVGMYFLKLSIIGTL